VAGRSFALSFAPGDAGAAAVVWAQWVHEGEIENVGGIYQPSLSYAYARMLSYLSKGDTVDRIWIYAHGNASGYFHAPIHGNDAPTMFDEAAAIDVITNSNIAAVAQQFHAFCTTSTLVHAYSCNTGQAVDALAAIRLLFIGSHIGDVCGPDLWFHLFAKTKEPFKRVAAPDRKSGGCAKIPISVHPVKADEVEAAVEELEAAIDAAGDCFKPRTATKIKSDLQKALTKHFDDFFLAWFLELQKAGLVPVALRAADPRRDLDAILEAMWKLWGSPWKKRRYLLMPFLSKKLLDWADIARLDRDGLEKGAKTKAVFPSHKKWKDHFASITGVPC
jgi:hypothetical protein